MSAEPAVLADLERRARDAVPALSSGVRVVVVDGPAGSGKTTLAAQLGAALPAQVLHMDDLYEGWRGLEPAWERLDTWVLAPLASGAAGRYRRFDWESDAFAEWHDVPLAPFLVVEGCGAGRREADAVAALRVWVEAPDDLRLRRGLDRDGEDQREHWLAWMTAEREHYARNRSRERADVRLDGFGRLVS
ncbi:(d)CMP kinase [Cellulosimicrobium terreum]|nr:(d)CMP kinase [Cellulosimicrobium terreum]